MLASIKLRCPDHILTAGLRCQARHLPSPSEDQRMQVSRPGAAHHQEQLIIKSQLSPEVRSSGTPAMRGSLTPLAGA
jgi:hypothetical protein